MLNMDGRMGRMGFGLLCFILRILFIDVNREEC